MTAAEPVFKTVATSCTCSFQRLAAKLGSASASAVKTSGGIQPRSTSGWFFMMS